ncbi:MAG TPA: rRNA maturation RNase YbeY [Chitinophagaceae bacterium]|jgi:rRNA maturation RNase YbeY|nr:rRNA maturation RNase YbeY [Chitinophagaceae bacterium]
MSSPSQSKVCFFFDEVSPWLPDRSTLKKFIESIFKKEGYQLASLNYIFCTDKRLLQINRDYLRHDYYTDIITFGLTQDPIEGEIYISVDRVKDNALQLGVSFKSELHRVIFHGALHLCGYRDKTKVESNLMRTKEDECLKRYF